MSKVLPSACCAVMVTMGTAKMSDHLKPKRQARVEHQDGAVVEGRRDVLEVSAIPGEYLAHDVK